MVQQL